MAEQLNPDGFPVEVGGVEIVSPGLRGMAEVHPPGSAGMRAAESTTDDLHAAFRATGVAEQLTVEIAEPEELPLYQPAESRSTSRGEPAIELTVPGPGTGFGQFLLYSDEDGVLSWHLPDDVPGGEIRNRAGQRRRYIVARQVSTHPTGGQRGIVGAVGKKLFKVVTFGLVDRAIGEVGDFFVQRWESVNRPHRLRPFAPENYATSEVEALAPDALARLTGGPALLLIHGTFSRTDMAFGQLAPNVVERLCARYGQRVFGFDHPTVGTAPAGNVAWLDDTLAGALPDGRIEVDVLAHSRGGLVGRLLAERPPSVGGSDSRVRVRQIVLVATPNSGTALASKGHIGDLLDAVTNIVEFIPDNPVTTTLEVVLTTLKQLATGLLGGLDGLRAMDPTGDFLQDLNGGSAKPEILYRAVASNFAPEPGSSFGRYARDRLTDGIFLGEHNDLVVPTRGVYEFGASPRHVDEYLRFEAEDAVDHSSYWRKPKMVEALDRWLYPNRSDDGPA